MYQLGDRVQVIAGSHIGQYGVVKITFSTDDYLVLLPGGSTQYPGYMLTPAPKPHQPNDE